MTTAPPLPPPATWTWLVEAALAEDIGSGDATSLAIVPAELTGLAALEAREPFTLAGIEVARQVFALEGIDLEPECSDGTCCERGQVIARVRGSARGILAAERTALNFLQRLSGIATNVHNYCTAVRGMRAAIVDTRKTTPGWRSLEKYAVACGGGTNHRFGLHEGILIKDNHIAIAGSVTDAVKRARAAATSAGLRIQVEVESLDMAHEAIAAGAEALVIDNQPPSVVRQIVEIAAGLSTEATGGVTLESVAELARTDVARISIGALTHSARAVDISLEWSGRSTT